MPNPAHSIDLYVDEKLDKHYTKLWYGILLKCLPEGLVVSDFENDDKGVSREYKMRFKKKKSGKWHYIVPLSRPVAVKELEKIVEKWNSLYNEDMGDFIIESNVDTEVSPMDGISSAEPIDDINEYVLMGYHRAWVQDMLDKGWRYASTYSSEEKTHPLLRTWDQLTDEEKKLDNILPNNMKDLIKD